MSSELQHPVRALMFWMVLWPLLEVPLTPAVCEVTVASAERVHSTLAHITALHSRALKQFVG